MENIKYFVGSFNKQQLINKKDKQAVEIAKEKTGYKYVDAVYNAKKNVLDIWLVNDFTL